MQQFRSRGLLGSLSSSVSCTVEIQGDTDKMSINKIDLMDKQTLLILEKETSRELLIEIINVFMGETGERMAGLNEAGKQQSQSLVITQAHAIKSSAGTFGANRLQEAASRVEVLGRQGKLEQAIAAIDLVDDVVQKTFQIYTRHYSENAVVPAPESE